MRVDEDDDADENENENENEKDESVNGEGVESGEEEGDEEEEEEEEEEEDEDEDDVDGDEGQWRDRYGMVLASSHLACWTLCLLSRTFDDGLSFSFAFLLLYTPLSSHNFTFDFSRNR